MNQVIFTEKMKQSVLQLNGASQTHVVRAISEGKITEELAIKIAEFCKDLEFGAQQFAVCDFINGKTALEIDTTKYSLVN
jgi:hypothetical protein